MTARVLPVSGPAVVVAVLAVLGALGALAVVGLRAWRSVQALGRRVAEAGERLGVALDELERAQQAVPDLPAPDAGEHGSARVGSRSPA